MTEPPPSGPGSRPEDLETTALLLQRVQAGDLAARECLVARYLPILRRWAHGRLPPRARDLADTDDLVQLTLVRALSHVKDFEPRREGAFLAWLRSILLNSVRDEIRRASRRPAREELADTLVDPKASVVEQVIGAETLARYEDALASLPGEQREALIMRIEFGYPHQQIAEALGKPTANAARMVVVRALVRLTELMNVER